MKANFTCPKCKHKIKVSKQLHCTYTCPNCHYTMVLNEDDVSNGTIPFKPWFKVPGDTWRPHRVNNNYHHNFIQK